MLPLCDFVIIICPLTPETEKLFGEKEFRLMKKSATIINIARGQFNITIFTKKYLNAKIDASYR